MPNSVSPVSGMMIERTALIRRGLIALVVLTVVAAAIGVYRVATREHPKTLTLLVDSVAPGVGPGTGVQLDGLTVGRVTEVSQARSGRLGVRLSLNGSADSLITSTTRVAFAPGNTFGITVVALTPVPGGHAIASGASLRPAHAPDDGTMSTLIRSMSSIERDGLRPHMSALITQADTATREFLPLVGALGALAEANADTQRVPTADTLPTIAATLRSLDGGVAKILPGLRTLWEWRGPDVPGYPQRQTATIDTLSHELLPAAAQLLNPTTARGLAAVLGPIGELADRIVDSFPDAERNGRQLEQLIERVRRSMPDDGRGPVLKMSVLFQRIPPLQTLIPPTPTFRVTPPATTPSATAPPATAPPATAAATAPAATPDRAAPSSPAPSSPAPDGRR